MHIASTLIRLEAWEREPLLQQIMTASAVLPFASEVLQWSRVRSGDQVAPEARPLTAEQITALEEQCLKPVDPPGGRVREEGVPSRVIES